MTTRRDTMQRTILPIPHRPYHGTVLYDAKDPESKFPSIKPLRRGGPNVLIILLMM
jgi:arylsulfatase